jgi:hypothetical protein
MQEVLAAVEKWKDKDCEGIQVSLPTGNDENEWLELVFWNDNDNNKEERR